MTTENKNEQSSNTNASPSKSWSEELEVAGSQLVEKVQELIEEGSVRRIIIRKPDGQELIEIPLAAGIAAGAASVILVPVIAAIGALAALIAEFKIEIVREEEEDVVDGEVQQIPTSDASDSDA